ncbi:MAG: M23 family metallopeptidase [Thermoanaerobacteraceae bacterium]|nr:M23 family metallopeptidase [Thermoanaerobacteraceae bacterium]
MKSNKWPSNYSGMKKRFNFKNYIEHFENQFIISLIVLGIIMLFKAINLPLTNSITNGTKTLLTYDSNYENTKKGLKLVMEEMPSVKENVIKVFSNNKEEKNTSSDAALQMTAPIEGTIISGFGTRLDSITNREIKQEGIDIDAPIGENVKAVLDGKVMIADNNNPELGKVIVLKHINDLRTVYAYLSEIDVKKGEQVKKGQIIGKTGDSGKTNVSCLHFEVWENGKPIDPLIKVRIEKKSDGMNK